MVGIATIISFVYIVFLRYCSGIFTWIIILFYHVLLAGLAYTFYNNESGKVSSYGSSITEKESKNISYVFIALFAITFILTCVMYKRIKLAIAIIKTASSFIGDVKSSLFIPILILFLTIIALIIFAIGLVYNYAIIPTEITTSKYGTIHITMT